MATVTPVNGTVTTIMPLNLRAGAPSLTAPIVGQIQTGSIFVATGTTQGDSVDGNAMWYQGLCNVYFWSGACGPLTGVAAKPPAQSAPPAPGTLKGTVAAAPTGSLGFDCDFTLTTQDVESYVAQGYKFCVRYITRSQPTEQPGDLTAEEAKTILAGGLALMAVQHVAASPWYPTQALGTEYGENAVACAQEVGLPPGMNIWLDLEGVGSGTSAQNVIDYCNAWFAPLAAAGYVPGLYVGANAVLDSDELYWDLDCQHYWRSGSNVPDVAVRGYQLFQRIPPDGGDIDQDATRTDNLGGTALWLAPG